MPTSVVLPETIRTYFDAKGGDAGDAAACFTSDAVVYDIGEDLTFSGVDQIRSWLGHTADEYKLTSEVRSCEESASGYRVGVVISGDFPGSPYEFAYRFKLEGSKIKELAIDPVGSLA
ncbi:MAG: nuclear transport factor 2 family protein [Armatimonadetes bacterium]|nr:nuclear transport factor 2 family protein [Armatimonadota bacterium]